jgi:5-enolpyruvylshikimate-3-phosphate synthase
MEEQLGKYEREEEIDSKDHRVVQAIAMKALADKHEIKVKHKEVVAKTWQQFWDFMDYCKKN